MSEKITKKNSKLHFSVLGKEFIFSLDLIIDLFPSTCHQIYMNYYYDLD